MNETAHYNHNAKAWRGETLQAFFLLSDWETQRSKYSSIYKKILYILKILSYIRLVFGGMW